MSGKTVFIDRDGVINEIILRQGKQSSPHDLTELRLIEAARPALMDLASCGFFLILVTNQPDIARKEMTVSALETIHRAIVQWLGGEKVIRDIMVCPHRSEDQCVCRKPKPGMLFDAAKKWGITLDQSFIIGDRDVDMETGFMAKCKTILINQPYNQGIRSDYRAKDIQDACHWIKNYEGQA